MWTKANKVKDKVSIFSLPGTNTLVIRKDKGSNAFILTEDSLIISKETLLILLNYMVKNNIISPKALVGILEEINTE